jgi:hypothetical protein
VGDLGFNMAGMSMMNGMFRKLQRSVKRN